MDWMLWQIVKYLPCTQTGLPKVVHAHLGTAPALRPMYFLIKPRIERLKDLSRTLVKINQGLSRKIQPLPNLLSHLQLTRKQESMSQLDGPIRFIVKTVIANQP